MAKICGNARHIARAQRLNPRIFNSVKAAAVQGTGAGQWSARKAQLVAKKYKDAGGGYRD